jgi:hypothetical protein
MQPSRADDSEKELLHNVFSHWWNFIKLCFWIRMCLQRDCKAYLAVKYSLETLIPSQNTKLAMSVPDAIINIHATELEGPRELMVAAPEGVELLVLVLVLVLVLLAATVAGRLESAGSCV